LRGDWAILSEMERGGSLTELVPLVMKKGKGEGGKGKRFAQGKGEAPPAQGKGLIDSSFPPFPLTFTPLKITPSPFPIPL
jgi:hypothetical protein